MGPRHPGHGGLHLRQAAQQPVVGGRGRQLPQGRHVPGAADHRDPLEAFPGRPAQHLAHVRLAAPRPVGSAAGSASARRMAMASASASKTAGPGTCSTTSSHQRSGSSYPAAAASVAHRVGRAAAAAPAGSVLGGLEGELMRGGQVAEPDRDARVQRVRDRLPLRREHRERPERRLPRLPGHVAEQRHRRPHVRVRGQRDQLVRLRRALDQHDVGALSGQGGPHRPRRSGPVVPDPETVVPVLSSGRIGDVAAGAVEVAPVVALADHRLQVLLPHRAVGDRILDDGADDAAGHVGRRAAPRRRSARPAPGRW